MSGDYEAARASAAGLLANFLITTAKDLQGVPTPESVTQVAETLANARAEAANVEIGRLRAELELSRSTLHKVSRDLADVIADHREQVLRAEKAEAALAQARADLGRRGPGEDLRHLNEVAAVREELRRVNGMLEAGRADRDELQGAMRQVRVVLDALNN